MNFLEVLSDPRCKTHILVCSDYYLNIRYNKKHDAFIWCFPDTGKFVPENANKYGLKCVILHHWLLRDKGKWTFKELPTHEINI